MAKLHFSLDGNSLGEFGLDKERMTIGRRPNNDIHIDNLAISGDHAVITTIGNDSFLEDLNSTNGTLVNGKSVKKHVLHHGDVVQFGKYQLSYVNPAQEKAPTNRDGFESTMAMRPARLKVDTSENNPETEEKPSEPVAQAENSVASSVKVEETASASTDSTQKIGRLQVLSGTESGRELLLNKALTTLGKPGMQVAVITKRPQGYFITHVEGESWPLVNGQNVGAQAYELSNHDVIDLVGIKMEFHLA